MLQSLKHFILVFLITTPFLSKSAIIDIDFLFEDPAWSATAQFDDRMVRRVESPIPLWNEPPFNISAMRIYGIVSISIVHVLTELNTSDIPELFRGADISPLVYGNFGALVQPNGNVAIVSGGCNADGFCFGSSHSLIFPDLRPGFYLYDSSGTISNTNYTATIRVSEPITFGLSLLTIVVLFYPRVARSKIK
jgi:hypothetical protein